MARLPLADRQPRIRRHSPKLTSKAALSDYLYLEVDGNLLGQGPARMVLEGTTLKPITHTDQKLFFAVPLQRVKSSDPTKVVLQSFDFEVTRQDCRWLFCLWKEPVAVPYRVHVYLLPEHLGRLSLMNRRDQVRREEQGRASEVMKLSSNGHGDTRNECFAVHPMEGWKIKLGSLQWHQHWGDHGEFHGFRNVTESGFCVALQARGKGFPSKGRGTVAGVATWVEYRDVPYVDEASVVTAESVAWGKDNAYQLESNVKDFTLVLSTYWGEQRTLTGTEVLDYAALDFDANAKRVILKPSALAGAVVP